jgi:hypothetical protein
MRVEPKGWDSCPSERGPREAVLSKKVWSTNQEDSLTRHQSHLDLGLLASRATRNDCPLQSTQPMIMCFSSPNTPGWPGAWAG